MGEIFLWWLAVELLGIAGLPFAALLLHRLPDHGWTLAKPLSLLVVGWLVWFPLSVVTALPFSPAWILGTFVLFLAGNVALVLRVRSVREALTEMCARARAYILLSELVFAGAFALLAWLRSFTPAVEGTEKFMDVAFLASIWRAPHLPPPDPWLSGEPINYYYFGHYLVALLAKVLGTQPGVAFNIGIALIFALTAIAVFGVATNLLAAVRDRTGGTGLLRASIAGLVSVALVLLLGNLNGAQVWWQQASLLSNPWSYWTQRFMWTQYDWWSPSRAVPNTITEFPAFSFLLADLHAHVLALPFTALALGVSLNLLLCDGDGLRVFGSRLTGPLRALGCAVVFGALYAINGWDLPTYLGLGLLALAAQQWLAHDRRLDSTVLLDLFAVAATLAALSVLLYLPFYRGFTSPSQGVGLVPLSIRAPIGAEFSMFGLLAAIALSYLVWRLATVANEAWGGAGGVELGGERMVGLPVGWLVARPGILVGLIVVVLALLTLSTTGFGGWTLLWTLLIVVAGAWLALRQVGAWSMSSRAYARGAEDQGADWTVDTPERDPVANGDTGEADDDAMEAAAYEDYMPAPAPATISDRALAWLYCLIAAAAGLVALCELVYLRDVFAYGANGQVGELFRMNTVFKLYYQAWMLGGVACGPALVLLLGAARRYAAPLFAPAQRSAVARQADVTLPVVLSRPRRVDVQDAAELSETAGSERQSDGATRGTDIGTTGPEPSHPPAARSIQGRPAPVRAGVLRYLGAGGIVIWMALLVALVAAACVYPVLGAAARTQNFSLPRGLDGTAFMRTDSVDTDDEQAIAWLNTHVQDDAVVVEAARYDEYSHLGRVSAFTGLPTLLGWGGHELQWRVNWLSKPGNANVLGERLDAVNLIYTNPDEATVKQVLRRYSVRYVYVGAAERQTYPTADLERFASYLPIVYQRASVTIYQVPGESSR
jgi:YYY domain-containing protein